MATSAQQANGANNTLIVASSLIPLSSASQLSSVNSSLANTQTSLITQNQLTQQPFLQVFPDTFQLPLYQQQMFLPPNLTVQQNSIQTNAAQITNDQLNKKKANKQQKIISKTSLNQQQQKSNNLQPVIKSNMLTGQHQFTTTQNHNQAVVISQLPNLIQNSHQAMANNKKLLDAQKNKQILFQNNAITQQSLVGSQFKHQQLHQTNSPHLLAQQSQLINQTQLITPIQQIPQSTLTWAQPNQLVQGSPHIFIRQPHSGTDGGGLFIQGSNPTSLQPMPGTPIYMNNNTGGLMQLLPNHHHHTGNLSSLHQPIITTNTLTNSNSTTPTSLTNVTQSKQQLNNSSSAKLKAIKPAQNLNNSLNSQGSIKTVKVPTISNSCKEDALKKSNKKQSSLDKSIDKPLSKASLDQSKFLTKSTQQMNAELAALNEKNAKLQRSDSIKSIDSIKSKSESKLKKQNSLDEDSSSSSMNSKSTSSGCLLKKDKSEKKVKQKAVVKPNQNNGNDSNIINHYVDGFVIKESSSPFPVNPTEELNDELEQIRLNNGNNDKKQQAHNILIKETNIGKIKSKKLKKSKLKSSTPVKINNPISLKNESTLVNETNKNQEPSLDESSFLNSSNNSSSKERKSNVVSVAPISETSSISNPSTVLDESNVYKWSVEQVYEYLIKQEVSEAIAKELLKAQIDGKSIILLTIPILKDKFMFKLGPILSLKKKIDELKEKSSSDESLDHYLPPSGNNILEWSVKDTYQFILNLTSKQQYADEFEKQEMDGYSLTLINLDNIIGDMNIPFGPALRIYNHIEELKKNSKNN